MNQRARGFNNGEDSPFKDVLATSAVLVRMIEWQSQSRAILTSRVETWCLLDAGAPNPHEKSAVLMRLF